MSTADDIVLPDDFPPDFRVTTDSASTSLVSILGDATALSEVHYARAAASTELCERGECTDALETYAGLWRSRVAPALTPRARSREPLTFAWTGPFGHDYSRVRQSAVSFETAMLAVAIGTACLRRGRDLLARRRARDAGETFLEAVWEFGRAREAVEAWHDSVALAHAPPVLRRNVPMAMEQHARAWVHIAWGMKGQESVDTVGFAPRLLAGASVCAERGLALLGGVAVGAWRDYATGFFDATRMLTAAAVAKSLAREDYGKALALLRDVLGAVKVRGEMHAVLEERAKHMEQTNNVVHYATVPEKLDARGLVPQPHILDLRSAPSIVLSPIHIASTSAGAATRT